MQGTNRREFLGAAAAAFFVPRLAARPWRPTAPSERLQLGLIGNGIRGRNMLNSSFLPNDGFEVIAVCDVDTNRREDGKRRIDEHYGNTDCGMYLEYQELLARDDIDAVIIATPDHWHALQIIDACRAGKDVYCEKPLVRTLLEAQTVIDVVRRHQRVFQTGSQQRTEYDQRFVRACELIRNGRIGKVLSVNVGVDGPPKACDLSAEDPEPGLDWDRWLGPAPERPYHSELSPRGIHGHYPQWRRYREYSGGHLADMGAHHFDIVQWALRQDGSGPVTIAPPVDPAAERGACYTNADGTQVIHGGPSGATFVGTEGMIHVDRGRLVSVPDGILETELEEGEERLPRKPGHAADWLECLRSGSLPICDVQVGARSAAVCQLLNLAYRLRRPLLWDPARWEFLDDPEANALRDHDRRAGYELDRAG